MDLSHLFQQSGASVPNHQNQKPQSLRPQGSLQTYGLDLSPAVLQDSSPPVFGTQSQSNFSDEGARIAAKPFLADIEDVLCDIFGNQDLHNIFSQQDGGSKSAVPHRPSPANPHDLMTLPNQGSLSGPNIPVDMPLQNSLSAGSIDAQSLVGKKRTLPNTFVQNIKMNSNGGSEIAEMVRRERNREHAKRSRVRKKFLLDSLEQSVKILEDENEHLKKVIIESLGEEGKKLVNPESGLGGSSLISTGVEEDLQQPLDDSDLTLVKALKTAQHNFVITDPSLPDNPIVFASQGFVELTGYSLEQCLGRNCRFLQGPETDPKMVTKIRDAVMAGEDTSVCIINYRADGTKFWNQFFVAALRDVEGNVVNFVGVQCKVTEDFAKALLRSQNES